MTDGWTWMSLLVGGAALGLVGCDAQPTGEPAAARVHPPHTPPRVGAGRDRTMSGEGHSLRHLLHNARIKMRAERLGVELVTVPAHEPVPLTGEPYYVARECAAIAAYYLGEP